MSEQATFPGPPPARTGHASLVKESLRTIRDMGPREKAIFAPLVAATLILGVYPSLVTDIIGPSVARLTSDYQSAVAALPATTRLAME